MEIKSWKLWLYFGGYFLCFILAALIAAVPRFIIGFETESGLVIMITELLRIPASQILLYWYSKYILDESINKETLNISKFSPLIWGAIGIALPLAVVSLFYITGNFTLISTNFHIEKAIIFDNLFKAFGMSLAAGIVEEIVFRGYLVNLLCKKYAFWFAAIFPSFLFTLIHIGGADSLLNIIQLMFAGILVSIMFLVIYKRTGSIWNACIVHFMWNFLNFDELIDYGISNEPIHKMLEIDLGQNEVLNGGALGIEVSLPAISIYTITTLLILFFTRKKQSTRARL